MKKKLLSLLVLVLMSVSLAACGSSSKIAGTWVEKGGDSSKDRVIEIDKDGSYVYRRDGLEGKKNYPGTWKEKDGSVAFTADGSGETSTGKIDTKEQKLIIKHDPGKEDTIGEKTFIKQ